MISCAYRVSCADKGLMIISTNTSHPLHEPHVPSHHNRMNTLRAGVLGANDGIVSIAALLLGVIATGASDTVVFGAGLASTIAGAVSMALGEYVSVSSQRDTERVLIAKEAKELAEDPTAEHVELSEILHSYGISPATANQAATEIGQGDALGAHLQLELGIDNEQMTSPLAAAFSSAVSFLLGALLPMVSVFIAPAGWDAGVVFVVTLLVLAVTGFISAQISGTSPMRACGRLVIGGALGLAVTYGVGVLFGVAV